MARDAPIPSGIVLPSLPYSPVIRSGDRVFTAGQVAHGPDGAVVRGGIAEQTPQVLANLRACLAAAGCDLDDVQKVKVFLADLADFEAFNAVYREAFTAPYPGAGRPCRSGYLPALLIEVEAVARLRPVTLLDTPAVVVDLDRLEAESRALAGALRPGRAREPAARQDAQVGRDRAAADRARRRAASRARRSARRR